jgi:hypothetical protein
VFKLTKFITFRTEATAADRDSVIAALNAAVGSGPPTLRAWLNPAQPGSHNGGDLIWHLQYAHEAEYRSNARQAAWHEAERILAGELIAQVDSAAYRQTWTGVAEPEIKNGFYRSLFLNMRSGVRPDQIALFELEQREMARYMPVIRNWGLSPVIEASGGRRWDYVWEQEFQNLETWMPAYMAHPYHWGHIHRWFDAESPDWIEDPWIALGLCKIETSILGASQAAE